MLTSGFPTIWLIDAVIVFTLLECLALAAFHRRTGGGLAVPDFLATLVAGLCLMLALRLLASGAGAAWVGLFLLAAGAAHGADLRVRWRRRTGTAVHAAPAPSAPTARTAG